MTIPTTLRGTFPTCAISRGGQATQDDTIFIEGVPYHGMVIFSLNVHVPLSPATRLRRTARYELDPEALVLAEDIVDIKEDIDRQAPVLERDATLPDRWRRWHERTEGACRAAVSRGLFKC